MIRAFPTFPDFPEFVRTLAKAKYAVFGVFSHIFWVRGIDCDYSRNDPNPPDLSRTLRSLKPPYEESIATVPVAIRDLPNLTTATTFPKSPNE
ncbi:hypothetical protein NQ317_000641 [Molorchus minor]|uniref:Uncharacterized protein n=1 Tax=Molorchus minor TaxID=1323400 RepID=A0ABQ9J1F0_9CUCU|nr:hypothetical protein NQ317_000641 [Molorchus minor]